MAGLAQAPGANWARI